MNYPFQYANITRVVSVDVSAADFEDERGFFIRSDDGGVIKYCPVNNSDAEAVTKTLDASAYFNDAELCRKIFSTGTAATNIKIGYGV